MLELKSGNLLENLWDPARAAGMSEPELLLYRSNLLGADKRITNYGGGNTSAKVTRDRPAHRREGRGAVGEGSGGDLGSIKLDGFATLYMDKLEALKGLYRGVDARGRDGGLPAHCTFNLNPRAASIDTPLHAYVPRAHVDHMHPDAIIAIAASKDSQRADRRRSSATRSAGCPGSGRASSSASGSGSSAARTRRRRASCSKATGSSPGATTRGAATTRRSTSSTAPSSGSTSAPGASRPSAAPGPVAAGRRAAEGRGAR